jgi:hypothetical protein
MKRSMIVATAGALVVAPAASADVMGDLSRAGACWTRTYDAAHLRAHPAQTVTRVSLMSMNSVPGQAKNVRGVVFGMRQRPGNELSVASAECRASGAGARCTAQMDAGAFRFDSRPKGVLRLTVAGSLQLERMSGDYTANLASSDDRVFDLSPAPTSACRAETLSSN